VSRRGHRHRALLPHGTVHRGTSPVHRRQPPIPASPSFLPHHRAVDSAAPAGARGQRHALPTVALDNAPRCPQRLGRRSASTTLTTPPATTSFFLTPRRGPTEGMWIVPCLWTALRVDHSPLDNTPRCPHGPQPRRHDNGLRPEATMYQTDKRSPSSVIYLAPSERNSCRWPKFIIDAGQPSPDWG